MDSLLKLKVPYYPLASRFPRLRTGISPLDNGLLSNFSHDEAEGIRRNDPTAARFLRPLVGDKDLLQGEQRWCLWLEGVDASTIESSPELSRRVEALKKFRSNSKSKKTRQWKDSSEMVTQGKEARKDYLAIPLNVNETYEYLPVTHLSSEVVANQTVGVIEEEEFFVAGILSSRIFHLWKKTTLAHFDIGEKISTFALYQTIPVPVMESEEQMEIEHNFERVLRVRGNFMPNTLAELYSPRFKPDQLRQAHKRLNDSVYKAYRFDEDISEEEICDQLFLLHQRLVTAS